MSLLKYLQFQPIDPDSDRDEISPEHQARQEIKLDEDIKEEDLDIFWDEVVKDIHKDPTWFDFSSK